MSEVVVTSSSSILRISRRGPRFFDGDRQVPAQKISDLLRALRSPAVGEPSARELVGSRKAFLKAANEYCSREFKGFSYTAKAGPLMRKACARRLADPAAVDPAISAYFRSFWTDDYPVVSILIRHERGTLNAESTAQHAFMLPWRISAPSGYYDTYEPGISRALGRLLSKGFPNLERIRGDNWPTALFRRMLPPTDPEIARIEAHAEFGWWLDGLSKRYALLESNIHTTSSIDIEPSKRWHGKLAEGDLPVNVIFDVSVLRDLAPKHAEFERQLEALKATVSGTPWIWAFVQSHPDVTVEVRYVDGVSLTHKAQNILRRDLSGSSALGELTDEQIKAAVFVTLSAKDARCGRGSSRWLILPNGGVLLWEFRGTEPLRERFEPLTPIDCRGIAAGHLIDRDGRAVVRSEPAAAQ